ncbi:MAG: ferritin-like domain-containing protein [Candidatus Rifleibacteriota bacterium]
MTSFNYNADEIIELAIQIEKNGRDYFLAMAEKTDNPKVREVFNYLVNEEESHLGIFKEIRAKLAQKEPEMEIADEYKTPEMYNYVKAMFDGRVFPDMKSHREVTAEIKTDEQAIYHAISFEKDTVLFFNEILNLLGEDDENRPLIEELIRQEKIHIARLFTLMGNIKQ